MEYVKNNTTIPLPKVYFCDSSHNNSLGAPFMVMDYIDGVPIPFSDIDLEHLPQVTKLYKPICHISYQLCRLRFNKIGSLYTGSPTDSIHTMEFRPKFRWDGVQYGPFTNVRDYYISLANRYWEDALSSMRGLMKHVPANWTWKDATNAEKHLFTAFPHLESLRLLLRSEHPLATEICLEHHDLKLRNILVKEETVVGVIDWDECATVPFLGFNPVPLQGRTMWKCVLIFLRRSRGTRVVMD